MKKNRYLFYIIYIFFASLCVIPNMVYGANADKNTLSKNRDKGGVLILSSYNPEIKRMSSFISDFELAITSESSDYEVYIENLNFMGIEENQYWKDNIQKILDKYKDIKAIILLGQEAWATYLSSGGYDAKVPFFGAIASENGVLIGHNSIVTYPENVDFKAKADSLGYAGGALNRYDFKKNIKLIKTIYQNVENIALVSDNTYGGIALQSLFISEMKTEPDLKPILLDARDGIEEVGKKVQDLNENSVIILGTWRIGNRGQYLMNSSLEQIISKTERPVFTISGIGLGSLSVGGAIPVYDSHAKDIAKQIIDFYNGDTDAVKFIEPETEYRFDNGMLQQYGIKHYQLPNNSIIVDNLEAKLDEYRQYIYTVSLILLLLIAIIVFISFLYIKNKKLKDNLKIREQELIVAKEKAEEANALKTAFLANMSHEIRTPLNAIVGFSAILCEEEMSATERSEFSSIIRTNTEMLLTLINDILDISRLQVTGIQFCYENTDVVVLMQNVIQTTNHRNTLGLSIILDTEVTTFMLNTDRKRLSQVLINLITNSYKFTKEGSITISLRVIENVCVFAVTDTGVGIPVEKHKLVFERFEKVDEFGQGTGLGLAICKQIVTRFGGKIYLDPAYVGGARVVFTIPI